MLRASTRDRHAREADRAGGTGRAAEALVAVRGAAALDAEVTARVRLQGRAVIHEGLAGAALELHVPRALAGPHVPPDRHAATALLHGDRKPVGAERGLVPAAREPQAGLEAGPPQGRRARARAIVVQQVLRVALDPRVPVGV